MKKSISFLLILTMILSMLCIVPAVADGDEKQSGDFYYRVKKNGTAVITRYRYPSKKTDDVIAIAVPTLIGGYPVTEIGDRAFENSTTDRTYYLLGFPLDSQKISIYLPDGITSIGNFAFHNANFTEINIPDSVYEIGYGAFLYDNTNRYENGTVTINININHPYFALLDGMLYNKQRKELIACFLSPETDLNIPEGIVSIGDYALSYHIFSYRFSKETSNHWIQTPDVVFPSTLTSIGNHAFEESCFVITFASYYLDIGTRDVNFIFPNVKVIGENAFTSFSTSYPYDYHDFPTSSFSFPSLEEISTASFYRFYNRTGKLNFDGSSLRTIPDNAFLETSVDEISIDTKQIVSIGEGNPELGQLYKNASDFSPLLTSIPKGLRPTRNFPDTIKRIESQAYSTYKDGKYSSAKVSDVYLPSSLEYIAEDAFGTGSTFIVEPDSYALRWCKENGFGYKINGEKQDLDWLNN